MVMQKLLIMGGVTSIFIPEGNLNFLLGEALDIEYYIEAGVRFEF